MGYWLRMAAPLPLANPRWMGCLDELLRMRFFALQLSPTAMPPVCMSVAVRLCREPEFFGLLVR